MARHTERDLCKQALNDLRHTLVECIQDSELDPKDRVDFALDLATVVELLSKLDSNKNVVIKVVD